MSKNVHQPVLLDEVLEYLRPQAGDSYLDLTAGYGGHAAAVLELTQAPTRAVLVDRDTEAVAALKQTFGDEPEIVHSDFLNASQQLARQGRGFDLILADLGISSAHLDQTRRGFSFESGPLDMRMNPEQAISASNIVNEWSEDKLADILSRYGQEPKSRQIARNIVKRRPLSSNDELAAIAKQAWPGHSRTHPATRTFQALRIAVNDELNQLQQALPIWLNLLNPGGRLAVISFHSGEDRIVKDFFAEEAGDRYDAELKLLTKKPVGPSQTEITTNPRARSAKLRAAAKIKK